MEKRGEVRILVGLALAVLVAGCHESEIEPASPIRDDWARASFQDPEEMFWDVPPPVVTNPAPVVYRPASISLGYVGDAPLTETPAQAPHWPWVQERFQADRYRMGYGATGYGYAYGYGRGLRRGARHGWR